MNDRWINFLTAASLLACQTVLAGSSQAGLQDAMRGIALPFVANGGQSDPRVAYQAATFAGTVFVTRAGELVYSLPGNKASERPATESIGWTLVERFDHGNPKPSAGLPGEARMSVFRGRDPQRWQSHLSTFNTVELGEVWPGVQVSVAAHGRSVEKLFTVHPGASAEAIRIAVEGAERLGLDEQGALSVAIGPGPVSFSAPVAYQDKAGRRLPVPVAYTVEGNRYGFRLGAHDPALPVVIDPLLQSTYLGGSGRDSGNSMAIHPQTGEVYIAGLTTSADFPGTAGGAQPTWRGVTDVFVARLDANLSALLQATYLGGGGYDYGSSLAIHPDTGEVYVTGNTDSADFPGTAGGAQPAKGGDIDAFAARLNADLTVLGQATYLGGSAGDSGTSLTLRPAAGAVYVAGWTGSANFPATAGGAQPTKGGEIDAFAARLTMDLTALSQATYLGGAAEEVAQAAVIHPQTGAVYLAGHTKSGDFPGAAGGAQPSYRGFTDAFVAHLNAELTVLAQSSYLGGQGTDWGMSATFHPETGEIYVGGTTGSYDFPHTSGGAQRVKKGVFDGFIARLSDDLKLLPRATYLGGGGSDYGAALTIHPLIGAVYVTGSTDSRNFPRTQGGAQGKNKGVTNAFVARINRKLTAFAQATYLGGGGNDAGYSMAIDPRTGKVYVTGSASSRDFSRTRGGAQAGYGGGMTDAFAVRLTPNLKK
ncbi:MAG: SBBP repeat-containing protein [Pseudomonadota bacterium]